MSNLEQDPLNDLYTRLEAQLRDRDLAPVGWSPHLAALAAARSDPRLSALLTGSRDDVPLELVESADPAAQARALVETLLSEGRRVLLLAPTPSQAAQLVESAAETSFALAVLPEALPERPPAPTPKGRGAHGSNGTVEFRALAFPENATPLDPETALPEDSATSTAPENTLDTDEQPGPAPTPEPAVPSADAIPVDFAAAAERTPTSGQAATVGTEPSAPADVTMPLDVEPAAVPAAGEATPPESVSPATSTLPVDSAVAAAEAEPSAASGIPLPPEAAGTTMPLDTEATAVPEAEPVGPATGTLPVDPAGTATEQTEIPGVPATGEAEPSAASGTTLPLETPVATESTLPAGAHPIPAETDLPPHAAPPLDDQAPAEQAPVDDGTSVHAVPGDVPHITEPQGTVLPPDVEATPVPEASAVEPAVPPADLLPDEAPNVPTDTAAAPVSPAAGTLPVDPAVAAAEQTKAFDVHTDEAEPAASAAESVSPATSTLPVDPAVAATEQTAAPHITEPQGTALPPDVEATPVPEASAIEPAVPPADPLPDEAPNVPTDTAAVEPASPAADTLPVDPTTGGAPDVHAGAVTDPVPAVDEVEPSAASGTTLPLETPADETAPSAVGETAPEGTPPLDGRAVEPEGPANAVVLAPAPETRTRGAVVRAVGDTWRQVWQNESKLLQRGLVQLEQWPRDVAALEALRGRQEQARAVAESEIVSLAERVEDARAALADAERTVTEAGHEADRLAAGVEAAVAEIAEPRAEAARLQKASDAAAAEAGEFTRTADAAHARCTALVERTGRAQAELEAARQQEGMLTGQLEKARAELPQAVEEAERLIAADADAVAEGHASYYRLVSAESALGAVRQRMSVAQRLHVAAPPPDLKRLRAEVRARTREADEAAQRARQVKDAAEQARTRRAGLERFITEGGAGLEAAREAQRRLAAELERLSLEREEATAHYREQARLAAEAVDRATQASAAARFAAQNVRALEDRLGALRAEHDAARATAEQARANAQAAADYLAELQKTLEERRAAAERQHGTDETELVALVEAEAGSRAQVTEIFGDDVTSDPEVLAGHRERAMARVDRLTALLGTADHPAPGPAADTLLATADLVGGTPLGVGAALPEPEAMFDVLIAVGPLTEAEFLIGAVRAHRWTLVGDPGERPPVYAEYAGALSEEERERLTRGAFAALLSGD
ncbi:hypothetical protein GCM10009678_55930 [Actinomadura kijaniata]|uniref:Uncharacterized protein n=1 Tax=Actinomadura namibiensis TaxID=182080 RepID=A0A7W3LL87_ACTNM|nr:hypothetical protein [Actinomadura namibiensis]MBA8950194.1 hypothetical protein [Actinomadura namibiensis]